MGSSSVPAAGDMRLGNGNAPGCDFNLGIRGKGNPLGFIERQGWPGIVGLAVFLKQDCKARKAIAPCGRLRAERCRRTRRL